MPTVLVPRIELCICMVRSLIILSFFTWTRSLFCMLTATVYSQFLNVLKFGVFCLLVQWRLKKFSTSDQRLVQWRKGKRKKRLEFFAGDDILLNLSQHWGAGKPWHTRYWRFHEPRHHGLLLLFPGDQSLALIFFTATVYVATQELCRKENLSHS